MPAQLGDAELGWSQGGYSHRRGAGRHASHRAGVWRLRHRLKSGSYVGFIFSFNLFENNDATQCTLALDTTVVRMVVITQLCQCDSDVCAIISRE